MERSATTRRNENERQSTCTTKVRTELLLPRRWPAHDTLSLRSHSHGGGIAVQIRRRLSADPHALADGADG